MTDDCCSDSWPEGKLTESARKVLEQGTFRETFLAWIADPETREAVRAYGVVQYETYLSSDQPLGRTARDAAATALQATLADLRYLKEYFAELACSTEEPNDEEALRSGYSQASIDCQRREMKIAKRYLRRLKELADDLEKDLKEEGFLP